MEKLSHAFSVIIVLLVALQLSACASLWGASTDPAMSVGISSDGRYAVTAHGGNQLFLWDLENEERTRVSSAANIYSAAFVPGESLFLWQDLDDTVHVQDVDGKVQDRFEIPVATYGHMMSSDRESYYFSDIGWGIHHRDKRGSTRTLKATDRQAFKGFGKLLNLSMDDEERFLVSAGSGEPKGFEEPYYRTLEDERERSSNYRRLNSVALWDVKAEEPIAKLNGNTSKTHATISPDGQWVVSGDENGKGFFWNTEEPAERHRMARYYSGIFLEDTPYEAGDPSNRDDSELIEAPSGVNDQTLASAFIHESQYFLRFGNNSHKAALFEAGNPWPQKYFDLGDSPRLVTYGSQYSRNTAIATAPEAGVLVMGHQSGDGISVYEFDAEAFDMERVWVVP